MQSLITEMINEVGSLGVEAMGRNRIMEFIGGFAQREKALLDIEHNNAINKVLNAASNDVPVVFKETIQKMKRP